MNDRCKPFFLTKPIAHRGLHDGNRFVPENTILAFEKAVQENYPIELDIQIGKDHSVIVFHDTSLMRACNQKMRIENLDAKDLKEVTIFNTTERIPTLNDVLQLVNGKVPIVIDIKNYTINKRLERALLDILKEYKGAVALQSFNPFTVYWLKKHTHYCTGYLVSKYNYLYFLDHFLMGTKNVIDFVAIDKKLVKTNHFTRLSQKDIPLLFWTLSREEEQYALEDYCDNYIFEHFTPLK